MSVFNPAVMNRSNLSVDCGEELSAEDWDSINYYR